MLSPEKRELVREAEGSGDARAYLEGFQREFISLPLTLKALGYPYRNGLFRLDRPGRAPDPAGDAEGDRLLAEWGFVRKRRFLYPGDELLAAFLAALKIPEGVLPVLDKGREANSRCPECFTETERTILCLLMRGDTGKLGLLWRDREKEIRRAYAARLRRGEGCAVFRAFAFALLHCGTEPADAYPFHSPAARNDKGTSHPGTQDGAESF